MWSSTLHVDWKQRFFVPTGEEAGVAVLTALITRYPILAGDEAPEAEAIELKTAPQMQAPQIVDLDQWIVPVTQLSPGNRNETFGEAAPESPEPAAKSDFVLTAPPTVFISESQIALDASEVQLAFDF